MNLIQNYLNFRRLRDGMTGLRCYTAYLDMSRLGQEKIIKVLMIGGLY